MWTFYGGILYMFDNLGQIETLFLIEFFFGTIKSFKSKLGIKKHTALLFKQLKLNDCSCLCCQRTYMAGNAPSEFSHLLRQSDTDNLEESKTFIKEK